MPAQLKPEWLMAFRAVTCAEATIRFNDAAGRWEFVNRFANGYPCAQTFGWFYQTLADGTRMPIPPDPETGLYPYRDLDDEAVTEVIEACIKTDLRRPGGSQNPRREAEQIMRQNREDAAQQRDQLTTEWAERFVDRRRQLHSIPLVGVQENLIDVPAVIGGKA